MITRSFRCIADNLLKYFQAPSCVLPSGLDEEPLMAKDANLAKDANHLTKPPPVDQTEALPTASRHREESLVNGSLNTLPVVRVTYDRRESEV